MMSLRDTVKYSFVDFVRDWRINLVTISTNILSLKGRGTPLINIIRKEMSDHNDDVAGKKSLQEEYKRKHYLVEVAANKSVPQKYHGNKGKHYLLEVAMNTALPKESNGCKKRRRRNVNSLSDKEKSRLVSALSRLIERGRYLELGNIHGGPLEANVCPGLTENITLQEGAGGCCRHDKHYLLPWHRLFIAHVEDELGEALPYWDWTVDRKVPDLWEGIKAPLYSPFTSRCEP